jgi:hypothetical protein
MIWLMLLLLVGTLAYAAYLSKQEDKHARTFAQRSIAQDQAARKAADRTYSNWDAEWIRREREK